MTFVNQGPDQKCPPEFVLPHELMVAMLLDPRRRDDNGKATVYTHLDVAAVYSNFNHERVPDAEKRKLIRRLLEEHA